MSTVILGGGIIGLSTAYYLSLIQDPPKIHVVDSAATLLASASGFAGGFVALDWFSPSLASLGALSFRLHCDLAKEHDGQRRWGYAGSHVYSLSVDERGVSSKGKNENGSAVSGDWIAKGTSRAQVAPLKGEVVNVDGSPAVWTPQVGGTLETIGRPEDCAQVEPKELCEFLLEECQNRGVEVHLSTKATEVVTDSSGALKGLKLQSSDVAQQGGKELECKDVVIAAGAWSPRVFKTLFPQSRLRISIEPLAGHSIVVKSPRYKTPFLNKSKHYNDNVVGSQMCYAIYCGPARHWSFAPEAFARLARNGETEVWLGGLNDSTLPLPELSTDVKQMIDSQSMKELRRTTVQLTGLADEGNKVNQDDLETVRQGLCFRPISQRGTPLIGKLSEKQLGLQVGDGGVWIASGHGPWGVSLSLGTGKVVSELLTGQKTSADIRALRVG